MLEETRTSVERLSKHLAFMRTLTRNQYDHRTWETPGCGTPSCNLGWARVSLRENFDNMLSPPKVSGKTGTKAGKELFQVSMPFAQYLFGYHVSTSSIYYVSLRILVHDFSLETTLKRMELTLNHMRRRLAILEVEEGNDWQDIPTGNAREKYLEGVLS